MSRDDFSQNTKELLAKRSGYICAYPDCKRMTVAGSDDRASGLTMTGIAAHITAASASGPRYNKDMSSKERSSESNGIWACQIHGKFIDDNPSKCTVTELNRWKAQHEDWVFNRVESGKELFNSGIYKIHFSEIGMFTSDYTLSLARHNILVGLNDTGKTTLCQIIAAFSGGLHWEKFNSRFTFDENEARRSFIAAYQQTSQLSTTVKLSAQLVNPTGKKSKNSFQRIHVEVNNCPSVDWPRPLFKTLHFEDQLVRMADDPRDIFVKGIRYLATAFCTQEEFIWDSLREELYATSLFGYRFSRKKLRKVDVMVPDGRDFYLPHGNLSSSELAMALIDVAIKFAQSGPKNDSWMFIFDSGFFGMLDTKRKKLLFKKFSEFDEFQLQTLFCLNSSEDADTLKEVQPDKWVNAMHLDGLTLHAFL